MKKSSFRCTIITLIYSSDVSTVQPNCMSQIFIKMLKIKCYLYKAGWVFEFLYTLYLAQNLQLCFGTVTANQISPQLCKYMGRKCVNTMDDREKP